MRIKVKEKGIVCGKDITEELQQLLQELKIIKEEKILEFEKGEYFISSDNAAKKKLYITNTIGDNEWENGEEPHLNTVAVLIEDVDNLIFEGNDSIGIRTPEGQEYNFMLHGVPRPEFLTPGEAVQVQYYGSPGSGKVVSFTRQ